jgi:hypothetical protein
MAYRVDVFQPVTAARTVPEWGKNLALDSLFDVLLRNGEQHRHQVEVSIITARFVLSIKICHAFLHFTESPICLNGRIGTSGAIGRLPII